MLKQLTFTFALLMGLWTVSTAQIQTPAASPAAKVMQTVGMTDVTLEYARPGVKGRTIFGDLVPYDKVWRTGANAATKITFSEDVTINGNDLTKGSYAILTKPSMKSWEVMFFNHESSRWSSYLEKEPVLTVTAEVQKLPVNMENLYIGLDHLTNDGATLDFIWADTYAGLAIGVHTDKVVRANIERVMAGPSVDDYYAAGNYLHGTGQDLEKALMYVQKATSGESPRFWQVRREALILADLGRMTEALAAAKKSLELAKAAGNDDYVRMNEKSIGQWSK